jgi:hypothetical protein
MGTQSATAPHEERGLDQRDDYEYNPDRHRRDRALPGLAGAPDAQRCRRGGRIRTIAHPLCRTLPIMLGFLLGTAAGTLAYVATAAPWRFGLVFP